MEILRLKYLKPEGAKQKNKTKARGKLFAGSFRKFDSPKTHADLTNQLLANRVTNFAHARQKIERLSVHRRKTSDWSTRDHVTLPNSKWRQYLHRLFIPVERRLIAASYELQMHIRISLE